jgi:hypothetical protein
MAIPFDSTQRQPAERYTTFCQRRGDFLEAWCKWIAEGPAPQDVEDEAEATANAIRQIMALKP